MKRVVLLRNVIILLVVLISFTMQAQIKVISIRANADVTLLKNKPNLNAGADYSNQLCNYDSVGAYGGTASPEESWIRWNLSNLKDSIGPGEKILHAEVDLTISWNSDDPNIAQGYRALRLADLFDHWTEGNGVSDGSTVDNMGGITWNSAKQIGDFEKASNCDTVFVKKRAGVVPQIEKFDITKTVESELNANKILTLRMVPYDNKLKDRKKWLGFLSLQANNAPGWGSNLPLDAEGYPTAAPHLKIYIGKPVYQFSQYGSMGDIRNYSLKPSEFGYWMAVEDEGDTRLAITKKTKVDTSTWVPAAVAVYNDSSYKDFDISVKAKMNYVTPSGAFFPFNDFIMIFGYKDAANFSYFAFYGDDESGVYKITNGKRSIINLPELPPAIKDTAYHTYRLTRSGSEITSYIDGIKYSTVTDDAVNESGKIGLGSHNDIVFFDDFTDGRKTTGIKKNKLFNISLYPNPVVNKLFIKAAKPIESIKVMNLMGQTIVSLKNLNTISTVIDLTGNTQGIYFVTTQINGRQRTDRILLKR